MADDNKKRPAGKRSPSYPSIDLDTAIGRAKAIQAYAPVGRKVPVASAILQWGYGPNSGGGHQQLAALLKYGLLDDEGAKDRRVVYLTDRANMILNGIQGSAKHAKALQDAALAPDLLREMHERWPNGLPADEQVISWLITEKSFNRNAAPSVLKVASTTLDYLALDSVSSRPDNGNEGAVPMSQAIAQEALPDEQSKRKIPVSPKPEWTIREVCGLVEGEDIVLEWSGWLSQAHYDEAVDWIDLLKRKFKRAVREDRTEKSEPEDD